jgi:hypothetical protein
MVTFRAIASLTKRSDSWRMASLDIVGARGLRIVSSITQQFQVAKPETWPSFNLPVDALREPHPVIQGDDFGGLFTDHDRWRVGVAADHVGHDARICNTQVQYSHDPEPWMIWQKSAFHLRPLENGWISNCKLSGTKMPQTNE